MQNNRVDKYNVKREAILSDKHMESRTF